MNLSFHLYFDPFSMREGGKEDMQLGTDLSNGLVSGLLSSA